MVFLSTKTQGSRDAIQTKGASLTSPQFKLKKQDTGPLNVIQFFSDCLEDAPSFQLTDFDLIPEVRAILKDGIPPLSVYSPVTPPLVLNKLYLPLRFLEKSSFLLSASRQTCQVEQSTKNVALVNCSH